MKSLSDAVTERLRADLQEVTGRLRAAEARAGRAAGSCRLLPVVKNVPDAVVAAFLTLGPTDMAENRIQARESRADALSANTRWHLIGHLQSNKARRALDLFQEFHALDSVKLAERLSAVCSDQGRRWPVHLQINAGREPQKHGVAPEDAAAFARAVADLPGLEVRGLMAMAPSCEDPEGTRPAFRELRDLARTLRRQGALPPGAEQLSMGMSQDFEIAVEEGATVVRIGSALFDGALALPQAGVKNKTDPPVP